MDEPDAGEAWVGEVDEVDGTEEEAAPPFWVRAGLAVAAVAYLATALYGVFVVLGDLATWAGENSFNFPGSTPSNGREDLRRDVLTLTVRSTAIAAAGLVLALWSRRRLAVAVCGGGAAVALVVGLTVYGLAAPDEPDGPDWEDHPRGCVEFSGEPSDCP
jgi:hypothetical protein